MDKIKYLTIALAAVITLGGSTFAQNTEFTPLDFSDSSYTGSNSSTVIASTAAAQTVTQEETITDITGGKNMQSAITELDSAQVEVRNELLNYKTQYSEVDAKYTTLKTERANLAKQVKSTEKRIKQIDKAKEKIRKNMTP